MTTDFASWHRAASENLIAAVSPHQDEQRALELLRTSADSGRRALHAGTNAKQRMLAMGLLMTVSGLRILVEDHLETRRVE